MSKTAVGVSLPRRLGRVAGNALARPNLRAIAWQAIGSVAWGAAAIILGLAVGYGSIIFPPAGIFGAVSVAAAILLWTAPDVNFVTDATVRRSLYVLLVVILLVPSYYAVFVWGLPQISVRRIAAVPFICLYLLYISTSAEARAHLVSVGRENRAIFIGVAGFLLMIFLSIPTSLEPIVSLSQTTDTILTWFIPFVAVSSIIKTDHEILIVLRIVCVCAILIAILGFVDFLLERNLAIDILPQSIYQNLMQDPGFVRMVTLPMYRNGLYRAPSIFGVSLSFGEFESMVAPLGAFLLLHGVGKRDRALGVATVIGTVLAIVASGARGGYLAWIVACFVFIALWVARERRFKPGSLLAPLVLVIAVIGFSSLIGLLMVSKRAANYVLGDDASAASDQGRIDQIYMAIPHIISNPISGHGFGMGGLIVGYGIAATSDFTIDSYYLSLLVETGVPSLIFFALILGAAFWISARTNLVDPSQLGALNGAFASAVAAFATNRMVLSQRENHTLFFIICGMIVAAAALRGQFSQIGERLGAPLRAARSSRANGMYPAPISQQREPIQSRDASIFGK